MFSIFQKSSSLPEVQIKSPRMSKQTNMIQIIIRERSKTQVLSMKIAAFGVSPQLYVCTRGFV